MRKHFYTRRVRVFLFMTPETETKIVALIESQRQLCVSIDFLAQSVAMLAQAVAGEYDEDESGPASFDG